jgi:hypothetical protein
MLLVAMTLFVALLTVRLRVRDVPCATATAHA